MGFLKSFTAVSVGAIIAACIMMFVSKTLGDNALIIFYVFIILFVILISFYLIRAFVKGKKKKITQE